MFFVKARDRKVIEEASGILLMLQAFLLRKTLNLIVLDRLKGSIFNYIAVLFHASICHMIKN